MKAFTLQDLANHTTKDSCYLAIHNNVYDLTQFLTEHPGGQKILLQNSGRDATQGTNFSNIAFSQIHAPSVLDLLPESLKIGTFKSSATSSSSLQDWESKTRSNPPLSSILNMHDMHSIAKQSLSASAHAYYSSGSDDEITLRENHDAIKRVLFIPRVLVDVTKINTSTMFFDTSVSLPIYVTATALGKLGHPEGETEFVKACSKTGTVYMMPTLASCSLEEMGAASTNPSLLWFQMYVNPDREKCKKILAQVQAMGVTVLCITVDAPALGKREKDMRVKFENDAPDAQRDASLDRNQGAARFVLSKNRAISGFIDPSLNWSHLPWFRQNFKGKILVKGIQCGADAVLAVKAGCDGIIVSNHGGRQLDTCRSGIEMLQEVINDLNRYNLRQMCQVYVDGGFRRGSDVVKALCIGANGVGIGRPALWGLSAYGKLGVERMFELLRQEVEMTMQLLGATSIGELTPSHVTTRGLGLHVGHADYLANDVYDPLTTIKAKM